jgi:chorismate-pyruvate lyase
LNHAHETTPDLYELVDLFYDNAAELGQFVEVPPEIMPSDYQTLLAHHDHMTVTVEKYHGCPVDLQVLQEKFENGYYARKILLKRHDNGRVVQFGIVRLAMGVLDDEVRAEIEQKQTPLGRILIEHNVLRNVRLVSTWKIKPNSELADFFGCDGGDCFGRTALIYFHDKPAVELLEIVTTNA